MSKKIKVLTLGDHPLSPSGVGTQTRYICEALLKSGKFKILSLGGAMKHQDYRPIKVHPWEEDWTIIPVNGYGTQDMIRSVLRNEKPDILWMMTDPRFYEWLWTMENEIRPICPIVYYHVWDNYPFPMFNKGYYESNDRIASISKLTYDIVNNVAPDVTNTYFPHAVNEKAFVSLDLEQRKQLRKNNLDERDSDKFIVFWNNRNARRKQSGSLLWWWSEWVRSRNLSGKAQLIMHTDPKDVHGQDLEHIANQLELNNREIMFSRAKISEEQLAVMYNMADLTINISDAEGFGLATLESLSCGTPIIVNMTGGLQEQITNNGELFGVPIFPCSKAIIGSQQVPYIYEDRISKKDLFSALDKMHKMSKEDRLEMGLKGRKHVIENYNFENFQSRWVEYMLKVHEVEGSWSTRRDYNKVYFKEIA